MISSMMNMKNQHDTQKNIMHCIVTKYVAAPTENSENKATGYPVGVFQSNGNLNTKKGVTTTSLTTYFKQQLIAMLCALT